MNAGGTNLDHKTFLTNETEDPSDTTEALLQAIVRGELAALRLGSNGISVFLESNLSRKIIYRQIIDSYYQNHETSVSDILEMTQQSRQSITQQVSEMTDMGLLTSEACKDRRRKCIKPTPKLLEYWQSYCLEIVNLPQVDSVAETITTYQARSSHTSSRG